MGENKTHLDFLTSGALMFLSLYIIIDSIRMFQEVGGKFYSSPGLLPLFLGVMLMLCALLLYSRCIKKLGAHQNMENVKQWFKTFVKAIETRNMILGMIVLGIYNFILVPNLPFWMASVIFLVVLMALFKATSLLKVLFISASSTAVIILLFKVIFHVPLP